MSGRKDYTFMMDVISVNGVRLKTINEVRREMDLPPLEGGDIPLRHLLDKDVPALIKNNETQDTDEIDLTQELNIGQDELEEISPLDRATRALKEIARLDEDPLDANLWDAMDIAKEALKELGEDF